MYISVEELSVPEDMLIRLTDDEGSGMVNTARAEDAITAAQAKVDASLSKEFDTPLSSPSGLIKSLTRDIAVYTLYMRVGSVPDPIREAYVSACGMLDKAEAGLFHLGLDRPSPGVEFSFSDREFTREYMEGF